MRAEPFLAVGLLSACATIAPGPIPSTMFDGLAGSCFRGDAGAPNTDTHCFTVATGGKLVMDVHKVRDGASLIVYEGVTAYRTDGEGMSYSYTNSLGDLMTGYAKREGQVLRFFDQPDGKPITVWRLTADGYDVTPVVSDAKTRQFTKVGPAGRDGL